METASQEQEQPQADTQVRPEPEIKITVQGNLSCIGASVVSALITNALRQAGVEHVTVRTEDTRNVLRERLDYVRKHGLPQSVLSVPVTINDETPGGKLSALVEQELASVTVLSDKVPEKNAAMQSTSSGLQYEDTVQGNGAEATVGRHVTAHYTGWLYENGQAGRKFDSSKDRNDPFVFPLGAGHVIRGWDEGVQGMRVGGTRRLVIPPELGYGARGAGGVIPPNAVLLFEVELLAV